MVVLNFYAKIKPQCISHRLGLYIGNLPTAPDNQWRDYLADEMQFAVKADDLYQKRLGEKCSCKINDLYSTVFPDESMPLYFTKAHYSKLASRMICMYQSYDYSDMPLGNFVTNCFDGRSCEEDYSEKIIDLINFLSYPIRKKKYQVPSPTPQWVYSSNHKALDHYRIFWGSKSANQYIRSLMEWGKMFDDLLKSKEDYLLFDYLVNSIYFDNSYNEYHLMKAYSLCQLFLEKDHEIELDTKLPNFFYSIDSFDKAQRQAELFRKMRNKIAHGDFLAFEQLIETYAVEFMDGHFDFDYSEYSRKRWVILHVCCELDNVIRELICMLLLDRSVLKQFKK